MAEFNIDVKDAPGRLADDAYPVAIRAGEAVFTRLLRKHNPQPDDYVDVPPAGLAFWLVDNWWRLRWECVQPGDVLPEWRMAHDLSAINGGYPWPQLTIWGEDDRVWLASRPDSYDEIGAVRFITEGLVCVTAENYERGVDKFLQRIAEENGHYCQDWQALRVLVDTLITERNTPEIASWRRLEARLGFDFDRGPDDLMERMASLEDKYGEASVEEAALAVPGSNAAQALIAGITAAESSGYECDFSAGMDAVGTAHKQTSAPPWHMAKIAASELRENNGIARGRIGNKVLSELLGVSGSAFTGRAPSSKPASYGVRLASDKDRIDRVALHSRSSTGRRFELTRALGDSIWTGHDKLGPLSSAESARQKFQRAFAANLLCPYDDLVAYVNKREPSRDDVSAAAQHFHVSELLIYSVFDNNQRQNRDEYLRAPYSY